MIVKETLTSLFKERGAGPFLFIGSGFSRRYLGLEDWKGLLSKFCVAGKPFEYYLATADGNYPLVAEQLAQDFNEYWWNAPEYKQHVEQFKSKINGLSSALRIEICEYLSTLDQTTAMKSEYAAEIELLSGLNVDGIITTNWDLLLEEVFPDYKIYIGQKELLFSNPQQIGEIYKIHGCSSSPDSLVLTAKDYQEFNDRNAYLAAKLITIFVEHPIVFLGYSISDKNISSLLGALSRCIGKENIEQLRKNLIFVQRPGKEETDGVSETYLTIDGIQIPIVLVKTNDFIQIYLALGETKRKIPARVLRYCKEQLYELVKSLEPEKKICVVDIDAIGKTEDIEFLVGVGVASQETATVGAVGYAAIESQDLISDLLHENRGYDAQQIVENVLRRAGRNSQNIPVFKYLHEIGIRSLKDYKESDLALDKWVQRDISNFRVKMYSRSFLNNYQHQTMQAVIKGCTAESASAYIPFFPVEKIDLDELKNFLIANEEKMYPGNSNYASNFRKLAALYDKLRWGW